MASAAAIRTRVRTRLEESTAAVWSDTEIDECVTGALEVYGLRFPIEAIETIAVVDGATSVTVPAGTRTIQRVILANRVAIPLRRMPDARAASEELAWELVADQLLFTQPLAAQTLTIYSTVTPSLASLPGSDEILIVLGAVCQALEARAIQDFKRGGQLPTNASVITIAMATYEHALAARARRIRVGTFAV